MTYTINTSDGNFLTNIATGTVDSTSSSLSLLGKNYTGYGAIMAHNFVYLTENFSSATATSLSQLDPGKTITDDFIICSLLCSFQ